MYVTKAEFDKDQAMQSYRDFLSDIPRFRAAMARVVAEWPKSCEHFLTKTSTNRIAWLGQSAMCIETGVPAKFKSGFALLSDDQQRAANAAADQVLQAWLRGHE